MPLIPDGPEILSRYIYYHRYIRPSDNTVKWGAFMPNSQNQTSVFRTSGLIEEIIWKIAECEVSSYYETSLKGRADIETVDVYNEELTLVPDELPYRHKNISGWSDDRGKNILIAKELEKKAILNLSI